MGKVRKGMRFDRKNRLTGLEKYQGSVVALHVWIVF